MHSNFVFCRVVVCGVGLQRVYFLHSTYQLLPPMYFNQFRPIRDEPFP
jgi:hypothetical protein